MKENKLKIQINRDIKTVFDFTTDPSNTPKWIEHLVKEESSDFPPKLKSTYKNHNGNKIWDEYFVSDLKAKELFELTSKDGSYVVRYTYKQIKANVTELEYYEWMTNGNLTNPLKIEVLQKLKSILDMSKNYTHQHDLNGCGIATIANLLSESYEKVLKDFESKFYKINKGIKVFDMVSYLDSKGLKYKTKFFNPKNLNLEDALKTASIPNSITLIHKNEKYLIGHYLLRTNDSWIDPWFNFPSIDNVHHGARDQLPANPWYVLIPN